MNSETKVTIWSRAFVCIVITNIAYCFSHSKSLGSMAQTPRLSEGPSGKPSRPSSVIPTRRLMST